jgi:hypothetical protein
MTLLAAAVRTVPSRCSLKKTRVVEKALHLGTHKEDIQEV